MIPAARWKQIAMAYPCSDCDAGPGEECTTRTGQPSSLPHAVRTRLASAHGWKHPDEDEQ